MHRNAAAGEPMAAAGGFEPRQDGTVAPGLPLLLLPQQLWLRRREQADECVTQNTALRVATCFRPIVEANYQPSEAQGIQLPIRVGKPGESALSSDLLVCQGKPSSLTSVGHLSHGVR